ncbi:MAG: hypothetical protein ABI091_26885 [Ferruginibacter sp.]
MQNSFEHGFKNEIPKLDVHAIKGYQKCLTHFYSLIAEMTEYNPAKRMIDAVVLLDKISATSDDLKRILEMEQYRLTTLN